MHCMHFPVYGIFTVTFFPFRRATPFSLAANSPGLEKNTSGSKKMLREKTNDRSRKKIQDYHGFSHMSLSQDGLTLFLFHSIA